MKPICDFCKFQETDNSGGVQCGATTYSHSNDGYGPFKQGAVCVHDDMLKDEFEPRSGEEISVKNLSSHIDLLRNNNHKLQHEISVLKDRLTKIDDPE